MIDVSHSRYDQIIANIKAARESGDMRRVKLWRNKLTKWQQAYGAYQPVKVNFQ